METFTALLRQIGQIFTWWLSVAPWEQAIRVRGGKHVRLLRPGIYIRIPFLDRVYVQSVRLRVAHLSMQTVQTKDRRVITVAGSLSYAVADIEKLYRTLHHAQDTVMQLAAVAIADVTANQRFDECSAELISELATDRICHRFTEFGLKDVDVRVTDFATIRAYRLLMDQKWGSYGDTLSVEQAQT